MRDGDEVCVVWACVGSALHVLGSQGACPPWAASDRDSAESFAKRLSASHDFFLPLLSSHDAGVCVVLGQMEEKPVLKG